MPAASVRTGLRSPGFAAVAAGLLAGQAAAAPKTPLVVERAILVMRHGIRAPLAGEVPVGTRTAVPWPAWPVTESRITPHGGRALEIVAAADRRLLATRGLLPTKGCSSRAIRIRTNSSQRTITSGEAYARGFAPGCPVEIEHLQLGTADPIFEPLRARATRFDATAAVASIERETGGMPALVARHRSALKLLDRVLDCTPLASECVAAGAPAVITSADGHDIVLTGAIRATSGVAQVLLLQYLEGMPQADVGWGRADPAVLQRLGALHAALFSVFTRPSYMAAHQSTVVGREILHALAGVGPRFQLFMGHDTNVTAVAAALHVDLEAPGYAINDVPPGGALLFERVHNQRTGAKYVRVSYRTQSPDAQRGLAPTISLIPLKVLGCGRVLCALGSFEQRFTRRLARTVDDR